MAGPKTKTQQKSSRKPKDTLGLFWISLGVVAIICSIGLFISAALPDWLVTEKTVFHWWSSDTPNAQHYNPTRFGLYTISFSGGIITEPMYRRAGYICSSIDLYAPTSSILDVIITSPCGASCVQHYRTRCEVYRKMTTLGYALLGSSMIVGLLTLLGAMWLFTFGKSGMLLQILWLGGGVANLAIMQWWLYDSGQGFERLFQLSQYPQPSVGSAAYACLVFSCIIVFLGLLVTIAVCLKDAEFWKERKVQIDEAIIQEGQGDLLGGAFVQFPHQPFSPFPQYPQDGRKPIPPSFSPVNVMGPLGRPSGFAYGPPQRPPPFSAPPGTRPPGLPPIRPYF